MEEIPWYLEGRLCGGARGGGGGWRLEVVGLGVEVAFEVAFEVVQAQAGVEGVVVWVG